MRSAAVGLYAVRGTLLQSLTRVSARPGVLGQKTFHGKAHRSSGLRKTFKKAFEKVWKCGKPVYFCTRIQGTFFYNIGSGFF
jgi:hypothetical protein